MRYLLGVFTLLAVLTAVPARANDLTIFGGMQHPGDLTLQGAGDTIVTIDPSNFGMFGVRASFGTVIGTEQTLAYSPNFLSSDNSAIIYNGNLILHIPLGRVRPYGTVGIGTVYIRGDGTALDAVTGARFAVNYGGGLKLRIAGPVGGQLDVRGYALPNTQENTLKVLEASVGIVFSF